MMEVKHPPVFRGRGIFFVWGGISGTGGYNGGVVLERFFFDVIDSYAVSVLV